MHLLASLRFVRTLGAALVLALSSCVTPLPYQAEEGLVDEVGYVELERRFDEVLKRSVWVHGVHVAVGRCAGVRVIDDGKAFEYGVYTGFGGNQEVRRRVDLGEISKVAVYSNHKVRIYQLGRIHDEFLMQGVADAGLVADYVTSLRAALGTNVSGPRGTRVEAVRRAPLLGACEACGRDVSYDAAACPNCGHPAPTRPTYVERRVPTPDPLESGAPVQMPDRSGDETGAGTKGQTSEQTGGGERTGDQSKGAGEAGRSGQSGQRRFVPLH